MCNWLYRFSISSRCTEAHKVHVEAFEVHRRVQRGLTISAGVFRVRSDGTLSEVPSEVKPFGGGGDAKSDYVAFSLDIPIEDSRRDATIRRYLAEVAESAESSTNPRAPRANNR